MCSSGPNADKIVPYFGNLFTDEPLPIDGYIDLDPKKPGTWVAPMVMVDCLCKEYVLKDYSFENDLKTDVNDSEKLLICFCYDVVFVTMYVFGGQVLG